MSRSSRVPPRGSSQRSRQTAGADRAANEHAPAARAGLRLDALVFAVALLFRAIYLWEASDDPTFYEPVIDAGTYDLLARRIASGEGLHPSAFVQGVFYPLWLALVYFLTDGSILAAKVVQVVLGALTAVLSARLARRLFDARSGLLAGLLVACYGPLVFHDADLLATGWASFWSVTLVLLLLGAADAPPSATLHGRCALLGLAAGLSVLTRATFVPFLLAGGAWLLWRRTLAERRDGAMRGVVLPGALALGGALATLIPAAVVNDRLNGVFSMLPSNGPLNLYIGNNPDRCATLTARPGPDYDALVELPMRAGLRTVAEQGKYFSDRVLEYARAQPIAFLGGLAAKSIEFVSSREIPNTEKVYQHRKGSRLLGALVWKIGPFGFPFGLVLPAALVGLLFRRRELPAPVLLFLVLYPAAIIAVHVCGRYRAPIIPVLAAPAAAGALRVAGFVRHRRWRPLLAPAMVGAATTAVGTLPGPFCLETLDYEGELPRLIGQRMFQGGRYGEAEARFREALERRPGDAHAMIDLGEAVVHQGRLDEGLAWYRAALRKKPDLAEAHHRIGIVYLGLRRFDLAADAERRAVELDPESAEAHSNLGTALSYLGRTEEALPAFQSAARLKPERAAFRFNLGFTLLALGSHEAAVAELERAVELDPGVLEWRIYLAQAQEGCGRLDEAAANYQALLAREPAHPAARAGLMRLESRRR